MPFSAKVYVHILNWHCVFDWKPKLFCDARHQVIQTCGPLDEDQPVFGLGNTQNPADGWLCSSHKYIIHLAIINVAVGVLGCSWITNIRGICHFLGLQCSQVPCVSCAFGVSLLPSPLFVHLLSVIVLAHIIAWFLFHSFPIPRKLWLWSRDQATMKQKGPYVAGFFHQTLKNVSLYQNQGFQESKCSCILLYRAYKLIRLILNIFVQVTWTGMKWGSGALQLC